MEYFFIGFAIFIYFCKALGFIKNNPERGKMIRHMISLVYIYI